MTSSVSSASGPLDVQSLVSQLMTVADQPLNNMQSQLQSYDSEISGYGTISSDLTSLQSSLTNLTTGQFIQSYQATSSNTDVMSATATSSADPGTYNVTVSSLASPQNVALTGQSSETDSLGNTADTLDFAFGSGTTSSVSIPANASLQDISNAINAAGIGVSASVVTADSSSTPYRLVLTGTSVGSGNSFSTSLASDTNGTVTNTPLSFLEFNASDAVNSSGTITDSRLTEQAQNANLTVNGLAMTSDTNSVTNAINGLTMSLTQTGSTTVTVATNTSAIDTQVQSFVTAYNQLVNDSNSAYNTGGALAGDYTMITMQNMFNSLLDSPISGANGTTEPAYLAQVGVTVQKNGTLSLNTTALNNAIANNPQQVANVFGNSKGDGFAQRFNSTVNSMLGPNGLITSSQNTLTSEVNDQNNEITEEQSRLSTLQSSYLSEYTSLNSALAEMEQTSSRVSSMIASA